MKKESTSSTKGFKKYRVTLWIKDQKVMGYRWLPEGNISAMKYIRPYIESLPDFYDVQGYKVENEKQIGYEIPEENCFSIKESVVERVTEFDKDLWSNKNIYEMYMGLGRKYGFIVRNPKWRRGRSAEVFMIGQVREGDCLPGKPPYYGNPTIMLKAEWMKNGYEIVQNGGYRDWEFISRSPIND